MTALPPTPIAPPPPPPPMPATKKANKALVGVLACAAGFVLLILVAAVGSGGKQTTATTAAPDTPLGLPTSAAVTPSSSPATTAAPTTVAQPTVVLDVSGTATKNSNEFTVGPKWDVAWSYDCAANNNPYMKTGNFIVEPKGDRYVSGSINELGAGGSDVQHFYQAGTFYLEVISMCPWHVTVTSL